VGNTIWVSGQVGIDSTMTPAKGMEAQAYFARQTPDRNEVVVTGSALERHGQATVAAKGCAACHGDRLMDGPLAPRLA
jgi:mono/diheme cytochrome c family protein